MIVNFFLKYKKQIVKILIDIAVLIAIFILFTFVADRFIGKNQTTTSNDTIIYKTDTIWEESVIHDTIYSIIPNSIIYQYITDTLIKIDTVFILKDYFAKVNYIDTLINNDSIFFVLNDTIQRNRIYSREYFIKTRHTKIVNNTTIVKQNNNIYVGAFLSGSKDYLDYGPQIIYSKNKWSYNAGFGIQNKSLYIGVNYKLK